MDRSFLIVAADGIVRENLAAKLRGRGFTVTLAESGSEAERVVRDVSVDSVVVESHLHDVSAEELRSRLLRIRPDCRVVVLTSFKRIRNSPELLRFGKDDYLVRGEQALDLVAPATDGGAALGWPWEERGNQSLVHVIDVLVGLIEIEYRLFGSSSHQAMRLARATAEELAAHEDLVLEVALGTLLRDLGQATLAADPSADPPEGERRNERLRESVAAGLRLFEHIDFPWKVLPVMRHNHEWYDGSGVPDGLRGREIPMGARIVAVVDAYIGMTTGREGEPLSADEALERLVQGAGHRFDPEVVEAFHRVVDKRLSGRHAKGKPVVLVLEPDGEFRRLLEMRLRNEGLDVEAAASREGVLEQMLRNPPALALIDVDGAPVETLQLVHDMQQDASLLHQPVVLMARRPDRALKLRALRMGVDEFLAKGDDLEELIARIENVIAREAIRSEGDAKRSRRGITGRLENLSLADIMQTLAIGTKTACVSVSNGSGSGRVWVEGGAPRHAKSGKLEGEEAFYEMVRWLEGEFVIEHGVRSKKTSIDHDAMFLVMEGLRLMDEAGDEQAAAL